MYRQLCAKHKGVSIGFQGDLNPVGREGFIVSCVYTIQSAG